MANFTIRKLEEIPDIFGGQYPGEMRMMTEGLGADQVAFTYRRMPPESGGKGSYGHLHKTQEEIYYVVSGRLQFKLGDDIVDAPAHTAVRVGPEVVRSVWNDSDADAELVIVSVKIDDPVADV